MAKAITFVAQRACQKEVLSVPQGLWPLHRRFQGPKGVDRGAYTEKKTAEVCEIGGV